MPATCWITSSDLEHNHEEGDTLAVLVMWRTWLRLFSAGNLFFIWGSIPFWTCSAILEASPFSLIAICFIPLKLQRASGLIRGFENWPISHQPACDGRCVDRSSHPVSVDDLQANVTYIISTEEKDEHSALSLTPWSPRLWIHDNALTKVNFKYLSPLLLKPSIFLLGA